MASRQSRRGRRSGNDALRDEPAGALEQSGPNGRYGGRVPGWMYAVVGALVIAVLSTAFVRVWDGPKGSQAYAQEEAALRVGAGIVVVDSQAALQAFMDQLEARLAGGQDLTEAGLQMQGADFGAEFLRAVMKYRDRGYLVLDRGQVLGVPEGADITMEIGEALGLEISPRDDPFSSVMRR